MNLPQDRVLPPVVDLAGEETRAVVTSLHPWSRYILELLAVQPGLRDPDQLQISLDTAHGLPQVRQCSHIWLD